MSRPPVLAVLLAALTLAACGDEDTRSTSQPAGGAGSTAETSSAAGAGDVARYCALTRRMDAAGSRFFARLERENATPAQFAAAERRFLRRFAPRLAQVERVAPAAIRPDVVLLLDGIRQRAGLDVSVDAAEASAAERRVLAFERRRC